MVLQLIQGSLAIDKVFGVQVTHPSQDPQLLRITRKEGFQPFSIGLRVRKRIRKK